MPRLNCRSPVVLSVYVCSLLFSASASGTTTITNGTNFIFNSSLDLQIGGLLPGAEHDQIHATGFVLIDGELNLSLINSWTPSLDDVYTLILANQIVGPAGGPPEFTNVNYPPLVPDLQFVLEFMLDASEPQALVLRVTAAPVPLPGAIWLFLPALLSVASRRRQ